MALLEIVKFPDPSLKKPSEPVAEFDEALSRLIRDMSDTMYAAPGVGLAAVQVGVHRRLFVMDSREEDLGLEVYINPVIVGGEGEVETEEGCLSLPDFNETVTRKARITIRYQKVDGTLEEGALNGFRAVIFQHELDHLNGILATDRISRLKRSLYTRRRLRQVKQEKQEKHG